MTRESTVWALALRLSVAALTMLAGGRAAAAPCSAACARRMAECRALRCGGLASTRCRDRCRAETGCRAGGARVRTLATVVSECRVADGQWTAAQRLDVKRGDCESTTVMRIAGAAAVPDTAGESRCESWGRFRDGSTAVTVGPFQRLGVSPDGRTVLFELNTHVTEPAIDGPPFVVAEEGIFAVDAKRRVRRLGDASRERAYRYYVSPVLGEVVSTFTSFSFSPNGRLVAFSDRGPGTDGSDAAQIVVMKMATGKRKQVTHFLGSKQGNAEGADALAVFLDDETLAVLGFGEGIFTIRPDGTPVQGPIDPPPLGILDGTIIPSLRVAGRFKTIVGITFPKLATEPIVDDVVEVFAYDAPDHFVQLTQFGRSDTQPGPSINTGHRVFFLSSANPTLENPRNTCQLFSTDRLGAHLRQLTQCESAVEPLPGCFGGSPDPGACRVALTAPVQFDARVGTLLFDNTCDPYGLRPIGDQVFAMRRDGSGLRQITNYGGLQGTAAGGDLVVELPGPIETSGSRY